MQYRIRVIFLVCSCWFLGYTCTGQPMSFRHVNIEDGLSQNTVNCILQDSNGFMWFGTQDGLNKYDGYDFEVFRSDPDNIHSLSHSWIWDIFEDSKRNLWIATWHGLTKYDPSTDMFIRFLPDSTRSSGISGDRPAAICEDQEGFIWVGTWGNGLNRYDPESGDFSHYHHHPDNPNSLPDDFIRELYCDSHGRLWIGTWSGLAQAKNPENDSLTLVVFRHDEQDPKSLGGNRVMSVTEDHTGRIWIGTRGGGLNLFHENDSTFSRYENDQNDPHSISSNDICTLFEDSRHRIYIGTFTEGLNLFDPDKNEFTRLYHSPDDPGSIASNNVFSIAEDSSGLIWIGAGGLNIFNNEENRFGTFKHREKDLFSLSNNYISSFYEEPDGMILVGTDGGGLNRFDRTSGTFTAYRHDPENPESITTNSISSIAGNGTGKIWVSTRGGGLDRYDPSTNKFMLLGHINGLSEQEQNGLKYINDMCFTQQEILWIATDNVGLIRYDITTGQAISFNSVSRSGAIFPGNSILTLCPGSRGRLWIGTWGIGLYSIDMKTYQFTAYPPAEIDSAAIAGNIIHAIHETIDTTGRIIWIGTSKGLYYMYPDSKEKTKFIHLTDKEGLPSNIVYGILQDNLGNIWLSTNTGLSRYNFSTRQIKNYDVNDGLQSNEFNGHSCLKLHDGALLFGGIDGFNLFHPGQIRESSYPAPIVLTHFRVFNKEMNFGEDLQKIRKITLSYKQNFFSFEFAALDYALPAKIEYAYMMEGLDKKWIYSENRRYASYTNINPGRYIFRAKGTNRDGVWSTHQLSVEIMIRPPYWKTWWFRSLGIVLFFLILYGVHYLQLQKVLAVERLRVRIASDLHDDIGSALTRISIASEQMQTTQEKPRMKNLAGTIGTVSRDIVSMMSDIIWSIDARNDTLFQLLERMMDFTHTAFSSRNINVELVQHGMKKKKKIPVDYRQHIFYIYKEVINNIIKHADATRVRISLINTEKGFVMEISDNGNGIKPDQVLKGNGLRNIRMRAKRLHARFEMDTTHGVKISLKMKRL